MIEAVSTKFLPRKVVLFHPEQGGELIEEVAPFVKHQGPVDGRAAVYVCENYSCKLPVTSSDELVSVLDSLR